MRAYQWLSTSREMRAGRIDTLKSFNLGTVFGTIITNECTLKLTPLLYSVDTNLLNADLIEFPPVKVKLWSVGIAEKIK
jgi:hypothetical protein